MIHREGDFEEWQLADTARSYIPTFLKREEDEVCYVPYLDVPTGQTKFIKFVWLNSQWLYVDNSQNS